MADAKRPPNPAPGADQGPGNTKAPTDKAATSSEKMPSQAPGSTKNTPELQRTVAPPDKNRTDANDRGDNVERVVPIQQSIPSGAQPMSATSEVQAAERGGGAPGPTVVDPNLPAGMGGGAPSGDYSGSPQEQRRQAERNVTGMAKLQLIVEAMPEDTPDDHTIWGYGGHRLTVGDLKEITGASETSSAEA